ncbi:hypothetical protein ACRAWF_34705 [Streptomyces sp. L7]
MRQFSGRRQGASTRVDDLPQGRGQLTGGRVTQGPPVLRRTVHDGDADAEPRPGAVPQQPFVVVLPRQSPAGRFEYLAAELVEALRRSASALLVAGALRWQHQHGVLAELRPGTGGELVAQCLGEAFPRSCGNFSSSRPEESGS